MSASTLPDKPSELILLALADLEKCEQDDVYEIDMSQWCRFSGETCTVCLAGSIMVQTLGVQVDDERKYFDPYDTPFSNKLLALDSFRVGSVSRGLREMRLEDHELVLDRIVTPYGYSPLAFKLEMRDLAAELQEKGL